MQTQNEMIAKLLFNTNRTDCGVDCIKSAAIQTIPTTVFQLPATDGTLVNLTAKSAPIDPNSRLTSASLSKLTISFSNILDELTTTAAVPVERQKGKETTVKIDRELKLSFVGS